LSPALVAGTDYAFVSLKYEYAYGEFYITTLIKEADDVSASPALNLLPRQVAATKFVLAFHTKTFQKYE
jgi:hypothetical protein